MGFIANGGQTYVISIDGDGPVTTDVNIVSGIPAIMTELFASDVTAPAIQASLGGSWAHGTGNGINWDVGVSHVQDTNQTTLQVSVSAFNLGGSFQIEGTWGNPP